MTRASNALRCPVSRPIREPLSVDASERHVRTVLIREALRRAMAEAEIELGAIALKVGFRDVVIRPIQAALEQAEVGLDRIGVRDQILRYAALARVFALRMVHRFMRVKVFT